MTETVAGFDATARARIADLRRAGSFFWADVAVGAEERADLAAVLDLSADAARALLNFDEASAPSRKVCVGADEVVFPFSCFLEAGSAAGGGGYRLGPIEVHVVVTGAYVVTVHQEDVVLPEHLTISFPGGRSEQYTVATILEGMVATAYDALNEVELALDGLQVLSTDMRSARVRMATLRAINAQLSAMRRRIAPLRGIFERIGQEIGRVEGLEGDRERYFERIGEQLSRLVDSIDAAADGMAKLIDLRVNETMYWLTVVATVFLPLTFITGYFGMNFGWMVDHVESPVAFVVLGVGVPIAGVALTMWAVRRRGTPVDEDP